MTCCASICNIYVAVLFRNNSPPVCVVRGPDDNFFCSLLIFSVILMSGARSLKSVLVPLLQILGDFGLPRGTAPDQGISELGHFRTARTYCFVVICSKNLSQWEGERCQNPLWEFVWTKNHIEQGSRSEAWFPTCAIC